LFVTLAVTLFTEASAQDGGRPVVWIQPDPPYKPDRPQLTWLLVVLAAIAVVFMLTVTGHLH
jgi:hypothetical protein